MNYKRFLFLIIFICLFAITTVNAEEFNIYSKNAIFYNINYDKVMYEKNSDEKAYIASLTKLMTALIVIENVSNFDEEISFDKVDYKFLFKKDMALSSLNHNKKYTYEDMLYDFVMESSGDCGYALAMAVGGSTDNFVKMMNGKATALGMENTSFANPIGLDDPNNYSTMSDMLKLMKAALENEKLKTIMSTFEYKTNDNIDVYHTVYYYTNHFKLNMPYLKGGKTGHEEIPGYALASYATKDGISYILITTNATDKYYIPTHFLDAKKIYEYYFNNYGYQTIYKKGDVLKVYKTKGLSERKIEVRAKDDIKYYLKKDYDNNDIEKKYVGVNSIDFLKKKGDKLGSLNLYYQGKYIKSIKIILDKKVHFSFKYFIKDYKYEIITFFICLVIIFTGFLLTRKIKTMYR